MAGHPEAREVSRRIEGGEPICLYSDGTIRDETGEFIVRTVAAGKRRPLSPNLIHENGLIAWAFKSICEDRRVRDL